MKTIKEINEAMKVLKEECESHERCPECPLFNESNWYTWCRLGTNPDSYKLFEEADQ